MKAEFVRSNSVADAVKKYSSLQKTVNLAKKLGYELIGHAAKFTKQGKVYQHWFYVKDDGKTVPMTNSILYGMLQTWNEAFERLEKQRKELKETYRHPELKEGEELIINIKEGEDWSSLSEHFETLRVGEVAYKTHSFDVAEGYKPLFGTRKK